MSDLAAVFEDAFNMLCGDKIGAGIHREVFACKLRPDLVVKVESDEMRYFANVQEMKFWGDAQHIGAVARWLAPCEFLSPDGRVLLQRRADPVPREYEMPDKVPAFLSDLKRTNFGIISGRLVCVDYAIVTMNPSAALKKAHWQ